MKRKSIKKRKYISRLYRLLTDNKDKNSIHHAFWVLPHTRTALHHQHLRAQFWFLRADEPEADRESIHSAHVCHQLELRRDTHQPVTYPTHTPEIVSSSRR